MSSNLPPWAKAGIQALVIVASILLAFGIEAWWEGRQEAEHRAILLEDLATEIAQNREALSVSLRRQRERVERITTLLTELGPDAVGLPTDSVVVLQRRVLTNPTYDPALGILELLIQSGDLAYIEDRELRSHAAGLAAYLDDYLSNQTLMLDLLISPEVVFGTGSVVFDFSFFDARDVALTTASPEVQDRAGKYLGVALGITNLMVGQGDALMAEFDEILSHMEVPSADGP
jgi:hypothetical protein